MSGGIKNWSIKMNTTEDLIWSGILEDTKLNEADKEILRKRRRVIIIVLIIFALLYTGGFLMGRMAGCRFGC